MPLVWHKDGCGWRIFNATLLSPNPQTSIPGTKQGGCIETDIYLYCRPATEKAWKAPCPSQGRRRYKHPQDNSNNSMVKEKLLTRKQSSRNEESYFKQDIGEQMEKGSVKRFGELETFWAQCLCQGTQIAKSLLFSSPNLVLLLVLRGTSCLSPRAYCGLEIISGIKRTRPRLQLLQ